MDSTTIAGIRESERLSNIEESKQRITNLEKKLCDEKLGSSSLLLIEMESETYRYLSLIKTEKYKPTRKEIPRNHVYETYLINKNE